MMPMIAMAAMMLGAALADGRGQREDAGEMLPLLKRHLFSGACKISSLVYDARMREEKRTIRYDDGGWAEQSYVDGQLHGLWTVFRPDGGKRWERQNVQGLQEGYEHSWDESDRLVEAKHYHLNVLHGRWSRWDASGAEELVGEFRFGCRGDSLEHTVNPDFNAAIRHRYHFEPEAFAENLDDVLRSLRRETLLMEALEPRDRQGGSFFGHVNVLGANEAWPRHRSEPLSPILQIDCADLDVAASPLAGLSFVTVFAAAGDVAEELGSDIVVRAYAPTDPVVATRPPKSGPRPRGIRFTTAACYPDKNDLPPGLVALLKRSELADEILDYDAKLRSRIGGWPGWLHFNGISDFDRFAFQIDSLDVDGWECGDATIHYFFRDTGSGALSWHQEMC